MKKPLWTLERELQMLQIDLDTLISNDEDVDLIEFCNEAIATKTREIDNAYFIPLENIES